MAARSIVSAKAAARPGAPGPDARPRSGDAIDWREVARQLNDVGYAVVPDLLAPGACRELAACYDEEARFRSRVVMARHNFGRGEYKYFAYPLPAPVAALRAALYPPLAAIANDWHEALGLPIRFPQQHGEFLKRCHDAGQARPTPLLLRYGAGDYNCLHQDLYGEQVFPIQATVLLSEPGRDFSGGEFVLTELRPRMQSRAEVVPLGEGDAVFFAVSQRPVRGARGPYRVTMRHGVSRVRSGHRMTLGLIFHDAR
ncbi:MAG: 2OG-Fe(II) oxygenase [Alphaproteobacteria bacterium]|nr:2OG-Fe(II) oxygenase [Alphaproteobacteria bacterium]